MESSTVSPRLACIQLHPIKVLDLPLVCVLVLFSLFVGTNVFSPVRFDREKIDVYATNGQIRVRGLYHYRNRLPVPASFSLGLPFPVDATHASPSAYTVAEIGTNGSAIHEVSTRNYHGNVVFRLFFLPSSDKWIRIDYFQDASVSNGRYILRSTRAWRQPLAQGEYALHLRVPDELTCSNYSLRKSQDGPELTYSFSKQNFFPSEDWEFSWKSMGPMVAFR